MDAFLDSRQSGHDPKHFIVNGAFQPNPEVPQRIEVLRRGAEAAGCQIIAPKDYGVQPIAALHTPEYLQFLQTIHTRWQGVEGAGPEVIPNALPRTRDDSYPTSPSGLAGYHQGDTSCPISAGTWQSAYWSAQTAISATKCVLQGQRAAYALCRPPGHHAYGDMAAGFCFLNNSAIAAQILLEAGHRPAILDVDVHHGNGTQGIFYNRADVLTLSLHADPAGFYPFFYGHADERGAGAGLGYNVNLPLPRGTTDQPYIEALEQALERLRAFGTTALVVALGLDAARDDPFQGLALTSDGFAGIGRALGALGLPTVLVQEGGYLSDSLGHNLTNVLTHFEGAQCTPTS